MGLRCVDCGSTYLYEDGERKRTDGISFVVTEKVYRSAFLSGEEDVEEDCHDVMETDELERALAEWHKIKREFPGRQVFLDKVVRGEGKVKFIRLDPFA